MKKTVSFQTAKGAQLCCCSAISMQSYQRTIADQNFKLLSEDDWYTGYMLVAYFVRGE